MDIEQLAGTKLGNYEIEAFLGRGGFGSTPKDCQISLGRYVVLNILFLVLRSATAFFRKLHLFMLPTMLLIIMGMFTFVYADTLTFKAGGKRLCIIEDESPTFVRFRVKDSVIGVSREKIKDIQYATPEQNRNLEFRWTIENRPGVLTLDGECINQEGLSIMTFNIQHDNNWKKRRNLVIQTLREYCPILVGLQEVLHFQLKEFKDAMPWYREIGVGGDDGGKYGMYNAILYRTDLLRSDEEGTFWLSETPSIPGSKHWGTIFPRTCTWARFVDKQSGEALYMYNTHLTTSSLAGRQFSIEVIAERIHSRHHKDPVILTGDFNTVEYTPTILYIKGERARARSGSTFEEVANGNAPPPPNLVDTFRILHPGATDVGTHHWYTGSRKHEKIDCIVISPAMKVLETEIIHDNRNRQYPSDHFPVLARMQWPLNK